jgi:hypothetical protein
LLPCNQGHALLINKISKESLTFSKTKAGSYLQCMDYCCDLEKTAHTIRLLRILKFEMLLARGDTLVCLHLCETWNFLATQAFFTSKIFELK